jgi:flavin reductase (DIM6/NTAB) family NADH-FMN oxidoreductase RutF
MAADGFDARRFRNALGCFATGVCVVTTQRPEGKREGLTVNSFSSVSLKPPLILWSLSRHAKCASAFRDARYFAVNVLAADQRELSLRFARSEGDKYAGIEDLVSEGIDRVPLLEGVVARFECRNQFQNYGGDHIVLIGLVERFEYWSRPPLLYHRGHYRTLS